MSFLKWKERAGHASRRARFLLGLLALSTSAWGQSEEYKARVQSVRNGYSKYEWRIPMRDGKRLFTAAYVPNGVHFGKRYPILMQRTPYSVSPYGLDRYKDTLAPTPGYEKDGYIFVFQDVRGRYLSEGEFVNMRPCLSGAGVDESTDTFDTIDWLVRHAPGNNGRVGLWGISYPGFYAAYGAIHSHPALKAVSPQAPIADWWRGDDMHRNGAFNLQMSFNFFSSFGRPRPEPTEVSPKGFDYPSNDAYDFFLQLGPVHQAVSKFGFENAFWKDLETHPNYDDFWQKRNLLPHLRGVKAPVMVVGGWYDAEDLYGPLQIYASLRRLNPGLPVHLVMGPWSHGGWWRTEGKSLGDADFGAQTSQAYLKAEQAFFDHHLKGQDSPALAGAWVFETGANRWRSFESWPPVAQKKHRFYLDGTSLRALKPRESDFQEFVSDPAKPVPHTADNTQVRPSKDYMAEDQRFASRRPDVLSFNGEVLQDDLTVAGPVEVDLLVSTSASDADWVVKLIDVSPGKLSQNPEGYRGMQQTLVRGEPIRGRFRHSWEKPQPFVSGQPDHVRFVLNDVCHTFLRGHRVMVQVQSSWFPYLDRNPQKWVDNIFHAHPDDFIKANHRVYSGSFVTLSEVK